MKLSEIVASLNELKQTIAGFIGDKAKATTEALTGFQSKLSGLETGAVAELSQKSADLTTAQASILSLTTRAEASEKQVTEISAALRASCGSLKIETAADATPGVLITAMENGVASTLAKLGVKPGIVPAPAPAATAAGDSKVKSRAEFEKLTPAARMQFVKAGGTVSET